MRFFSLSKKKKDNVVSGGLILGTVTLIEEDLNTLHYQSLCKYLLAEGAANGHALMVVSASANPRDVLRTLPGVISEEEHRGNIQAEQPDVCFFLSFFSPIQ